MVKLTISILLIMGLPVFAADEKLSLEACDNLKRIDDYIFERSELFKIREQKRDIFGLAQDIKQERVKRLAKVTEIKKELQKKPEAPKREKVSLSKVVNKIKISMTMPRTQKAIIDGTPMVRGQKLRLQSGPDSFVLRVEKIRPDGVIFRDINTGELAKKSTSGNNTGISRYIQKGIKPAGIVPASDAIDSPIQIRVDSLNDTFN